MTPHSRMPSAELLAASRWADASVPGAPPNMLRPPSGCGFRTRCPHAADVCAIDPPPELRVFGEVETACVRVEELAVGGVV